MSAPRTPGWALDVVLGAARSAGLDLRHVSVHVGDDGALRSVRPNLERDDVCAAVELFAALGVAVTVGAPYGPFDHPGSRRQANAEAYVPVLGTQLSLIVTSGLPPASAASEPAVAALAAAADAAHAAAGDPAAALQTAHNTKGQTS
jgi:hypothetical protein